MIQENTPILETDRLLLRRFCKEDAAAYQRIMGEEETNRFLPWFPTQTLDEAQAHLQTHFLRFYDLPSAYRYAVCLKEGNLPIGYVTVSDGENRDIGYGLCKEYWHRGMVTEAAQAVAERVKKAGYPFLTATHDVNNPRSAAVMRKLGMTYRYSYVERWQPKDILVTFRMYQINFDGAGDVTYMEYWEKYQPHFIEKDL